MIWLKELKPAEWVVLAFLAVCLTLISTHSSPDWSSLQLGAYPIWSLLMIALAVTLLKVFNGKKRLGLIFAVPCLFSSHWIFFAIFAITFFGQALWLQKLPEVSHFLRPILPLLFVLCAYPLVPLIITSLQVPDRDLNLQAIDRALFFGNDPQLLIEPLIKNWISEWMAFVYSMYAFLLFGVVALIYLKSDKKAIEETFLNLVLIFTLGYLLYACVPAIGPVFTQHYSVDLNLYYMASVKEMLMDKTRIDRDCFPSLHTAVSFAAGLALYRHQRKFFWLSLPVILSMPLACVYLRYHYVIDVVAGLGLVSMSSLLSHHLNKVVPVVTKTRLKL